MDIDEAIIERHSVRQYTDRKIEGDVLNALNEEIARINEESGLRMRLITDEPSAFGGLMLRMVKFRNAVNYIAIIGKDDADLNMKAGYYGERLVLYAQTLGLNTCWALLCSKKHCERFIEKGERMAIGISIGYGVTEGVPHKSRPVEEVADMTDAPGWFRKGVDYALLAPTGMNKQAFRIERNGNGVYISGKDNTLGQIDLGIVKYHFECGAGRDNFNWI